MLFAFPVVLDAPMGQGHSETIESEARAFMAAYADDLRSGRRERIAKRYFKGGAYRVGEGQSALEPWDVIHTYYMTQWAPPASFDWRNLSYEPLGPDAIVVTGLFDWKTESAKGFTYSYTGLLIREDGDLRIRLEDESMKPPNGAG